MEKAPVNHWYDWVFWIFFGGGVAFIAGIIIYMIVEAIRDRRPRPSRASGGGSHETWGLAGTSASDVSTSFEASSSSSDLAADSGGGDSGGGGFESGGGDSGGGGSSGGWND